MHPLVGNLDNHEKVSLLDMTMTHMKSVDHGTNESASSKSWILTLNPISFGISCKCSLHFKGSLLSRSE